MLHISYLFANIMANNSNSLLLNSLVQFDGKVHVAVGTLPLDLRRVFIVLERLSEHSFTNDSPSSKDIDTFLTNKHLWLHQHISKIFNLKPFDEVVICDGWVVATVNMAALINQPLIKETHRVPVRYCNDTASY